MVEPEKKFDDLIAESQTDIPAPSWRDIGKIAWLLLTIGIVGAVAILVALFGAIVPILAILFSFYARG